MLFRLIIIIYDYILHDVLHMFITNTRAGLVLNAYFAIINRKKYDNKLGVKIKQLYLHPASYTNKYQANLQWKLKLLHL